ncbi:hypothetical protein [Phyllobacterium ifriqiyense]|uniref:hypothetical protein n=1 Tax=Phyllobacterium ifriqiyense TaxID=314238 RepID=UPI00339170C8
MRREEIQPRPFKYFNAVSWGTHTIFSGGTMSQPPSPEIETFKMAILLAQRDLRQPLTPQLRDRLLGTIYKFHGRGITDAGVLSTLAANRERALMAKAEKDMRSAQRRKKQNSPQRRSSASLSQQSARN